MKQEPEHITEIKKEILRNLVDDMDPDLNELIASAPHTPDTAAPDSKKEGQPACQVVPVVKDNNLQAIIGNARIYADGCIMYDLPDSFVQSHGALLPIQVVNGKNQLDDGRWIVHSRIVAFTTAL